MDFIEQLPASEGFSAILVVVDHLTKQAIFIPSHDIVNALQVVRLFLTHIFSKHGVLLHVVMVHLVCMPPTISNHPQLCPPTLWCHSDAHCISSHNHATPVAGLN